MSAVVTGWGRLNSTGPQSDRLQEARLNTITNTACARSHGDHKITESMICAGADDRDACRGDSGGPLAVMGQNGEFSQVGVVSWGNRRGCAIPGYPGVYTRVTSLLPWIRQRMTPPVQGNILSHPHSQCQCQCQSHMIFVTDPILYFIEVNFNVNKECLRQ